MTTSTIQIKKISQHAVLPTRNTAESAGYDLYSCENKIIRPYGKAKISTGLQICVPSGTYGRIAGRSGLVIKSHIGIGGGVIDRDFRGIVGKVKKLMIIF